MTIKFPLLSFQVNSAEINNNILRIYWKFYENLISMENIHILVYQIGKVSEKARVGLFV
jgi:hypothetical protein